MGEMPVVSHGDTQAADDVERDHHAQVVPVDAPAPSNRNGGDEGHHGHDDEYIDKGVLPGRPLATYDRLRAGEGLGGAGHLEVTSEVRKRRSPPVTVP